MSQIYLGDKIIASTLGSDIKYDENTSVNDKIDEHATLIDEQNKNLQIIDVEVEKNNNVTFNNFHCYYVPNEKRLHIEFDFTCSGINTTTPLITLPEGYKPKTQKNFCGWFKTSANDGAAKVHIGTDGALIQLYSNGTIEGIVNSDIRL